MEEGRWICMAEANQASTLVQREKEEASMPAGDEGMSARQLERIMDDISDIKLNQERLRAEFAVGFTPRDIHNLEMTTLREQITTTRKQNEDAITRLEKQREKDEEQAIGKQERLWLRVGSFVALLSLLLALLQYLHIHP
jgi:hypothetical protein